MMVEVTFYTNPAADGMLCPQKYTRHARQLGHAADKCEVSEMCFTSKKQVDGTSP
jgi:hypothetical protein